LGSCNAQLRADLKENCASAYGLWQYNLYLCYAVISEVYTVSVAVAGRWVRLFAYGISY
jgi:hypothetical protein